MNGIIIRFRVFVLCGLKAIHFLNIKANSRGKKVNLKFCHPRTGHIRLRLKPEYLKCLSVLRRITEATNVKQLHWISKCNI